MHGQPKVLCQTGKKSDSVTLKFTHRFCITLQHTKTKHSAEKEHHRSTSIKHNSYIFFEHVMTVHDDFMRRWGTFHDGDDVRDSQGMRGRLTPVSPRGRHAWKIVASASWCIPPPAKNRVYHFHRDRISRHLTRWYDGLQHLLLHTRRLPSVFTLRTKVRICFPRLSHELLVILLRTLEKSFLIPNWDFNVKTDTLPLSRLAVLRHWERAASVWTCRRLTSPSAERIGTTTCTSVRGGKQFIIYLGTCAKSIAIKTHSPSSRFCSVA